MVPFQNTRANDKGVSEAIGFMLIFGIVIAGIGLVTLYGYPLLIQQQVGADEKIMEKNMIVLQNDIKSLAYKTVPYKETSLKIGGGSLTVYNSGDNPTTSNITIYNQSGILYVNLFAPGELRYASASAQSEISLQNGAVVLRRHADPGSVMLAQPRWFYDTKTNTTVINLINITSSSVLSKEGIGTVQMKLGETNYTYINIPANDAVSLVYGYSRSEDYSVAWDNYIMKTLNNPGYISVLRTGTPGTGTLLNYTLTHPAPMTLVIKKYEVQIINI